MTILDNWVEGDQKLDDAVEHLSLDEQSLPTDRQCRRSSPYLGARDSYSLRIEFCTVSWDTVCTVFDVLLLSWDSGVFKRQVAFHGYIHACSASTLSH